MNKEQLAQMFLKIISKQSFESFYRNDFEDYIQGEDKAPTTEQILKELEWMISKEIR